MMTREQLLVGQNKLIRKEFSHQAILLGLSTMEFFTNNKGDVEQLIEASKSLAGTNLILSMIDAELIDLDMERNPEIYDDIG